MRCRSVKNMLPAYAAVPARPETKAAPKPTAPEEVEKRRAMLQLHASYFQRTTNALQFRHQFSTLSSSNCCEACGVDMDGRLQKYCCNCGFEFSTPIVFSPLSCQPSMLRVPQDVKVKLALRILDLEAAALFGVLNEFDILASSDGSSSPSMTKQHLFSTTPLENEVIARDGCVLPEAVPVVDDEQCVDHLAVQIVSEAARAFAVSVLTKWSSWQQTVRRNGSTVGDNLALAGTSNTESAH